jgi:hypothetical protein
MRQSSIIALVLAVCGIHTPTTVWADVAGTSAPVAAPCETQATVPDTTQPAEPVQPVCNTTACYGNPRDALHAFTDCMKTADGQLLYNVFPACTRDKIDQFYTLNRKRVSPQITNSVEFLSWLLAKARSEIPNNGYAYGFSALILVVTNEPFDQLGGSLRRKGTDATFTIGGGEELVFSQMDGKWTLEYDYANQLFDELKDVSHLPINTTVSEDNEGKS